MKQLRAILPPCLKHKIGTHKNTAPRTLIDNIQITRDDIEGDLHEGRD